MALKAEREREREFFENAQKKPASDFERFESSEKKNPYIAGPRYDSMTVNPCVCSVYLVVEP